MSGDDLLTSLLPIINLACIAADNVYLDSISSPPTPRYKFTREYNPAEFGTIYILAIAGSQTFPDWRVNFNCKPVFAEDILGNKENQCHTGYLLSVRQIIIPLLAFFNEIGDSKFLLTGHSAGGAIASLLYTYITVVKGRSSNIHCIVFGSPPISVSPLTDHAEKTEINFSNGSIFLSLFNEGDPVLRAYRKLPFLSRYRGHKSGYMNSGILHYIKYFKGKVSIHRINDKELKREKKIVLSAHSITSYRQNIDDLLRQRNYPSKKANRDLKAILFACVFLL